MKKGLGVRRTEEGPTIIKGTHMVLGLPKSDVPEAQEWQDWQSHITKQQPIVLSIHIQISITR